MNKLIRASVIVILLFVSFTQGLDIEKACEELREQENSPFSQMSTSRKEANQAGQCIGWVQVNKGASLNMFEACTELIEQDENLLGSMSTSLLEANQAGICLAHLRGF